jgi:hypothetical protein
MSVDASVVVDFHLAGRLALLDELFRGRLLMSDFVEQELTEGDIQITAAQTVTPSSTEEWTFFGGVRRRKPGLGLGELGALTVAHFHNAILVTNDRQATGRRRVGPPCPRGPQRAGIRDRRCTTFGAGGCGNSGGDDPAGRVDF